MPVGACWSQRTVAFFERFAYGDVGGKPKPEVSSQERSKREVVVWRMRAITSDQLVGDRLDFGCHGVLVVKGDVLLRGQEAYRVIKGSLMLNAKTAEESRGMPRDIRHLIGHYRYFYYCC